MANDKEPKKQENLLSVNFRGEEYPLDATLRVAYRYQGMNNHTPYTKLIQDFGNKKIEDQVGLLYCAFIIANPFQQNAASPKEFLNDLLEHCSANYILARALKVITTMLGGDTAEAAAEEKKPEEPEMPSEEFEAMPSADEG